MAKVYVKTDDAGRVLQIASSVFLGDPAGWVLIDEGDGDHYVHAQGNYLGKPLTGEDGTHNYILEDGTVRETTEEEKQAERDAFPEPEPGREDELEAQVLSLRAQIDALLGVSE